jgi:hypothetical protein
VISLGYVEGAKVSAIQYLDTRVLTVTAFSILGITGIIVWDIQERLGPVLGTYENDIVLIAILSIVLLVENRDKRKFGFKLRELKTMVLRMVSDGEIDSEELITLRNWILNSIIELMKDTGDPGE